MWRLFFLNLACCNTRTKNNGSLCHTESLPAMSKMHRLQQWVAQFCTERRRESLIWEEKSVATPQRPTSGPKTNSPLHFLIQLVHGCDYSDIYRERFQRPPLLPLASITHSDGGPASSPLSTSREYPLAKDTSPWAGKRLSLRRQSFPRRRWHRTKVIS